MKLLSSVMCVVFLVTSSITVSASTLLKEFKVRFTDKNGISIANSLITMYPATKPKFEDYKYLRTDGNGEVRVSNIKSGNWVILLEIADEDKVVEDKLTYKFTAENTKKLVTVKSKLENKNEAGFNEKVRTDIYLRNTKNGVVRNMRVQLGPNFLVPQPSDPHDRYTPSAYTNADGRVTFTSLRAGAEYDVKYTWLGGEADGGKIKIGDDGITTFTLQFDEALLEKK